MKKLIGTGRMGPSCKRLAVLLAIAGAAALADCRAEASAPSGAGRPPATAAYFTSPEAELVIRAIQREKEVRHH